MYRFFHKHRYWFLALILVCVVAIVYFQFLDDGGLAPGEQPNQRLPLGP